MTELASRIRDLIFSYDRSRSLPDPDSFDADADVDPDDRERVVLRGLDLDVPTGSFTVVMGASGGGKSTLLYTLNGLIPNHIRGSYDGTVEVLGRDVASRRVSEMARDVGMVLQDYEAQLFGTSVAAEARFGAENLMVSIDEIDRRVERALELVGLADLDRRRPPASLSGGQKQRLVVAGVLAMHPDLLVLDEPTSDLDPEGTRETLEVVRGLARSRVRESSPAPSAATDGAGETLDGPETIVMVTHKIEDALLADHAVLLRGGKVYRSGPAREVFTDVGALRDARVSVPPLVEAFDRLGWPREELPLTPEEAAERVRERGLEWTPPAVAGEEILPPADTGARLGDPLFELAGVVYEYDTDQGPIRAVDDVDLTIRDGESVAIVGQNGSGKTTLAKHLNGLFEPDEGTVLWNGEDLSSYTMAEIGRHIGYVFQNPDHQIFERSVRREVEFGPKNFGIEGDRLDRLVDEALETVELSDLDEADPFNLSKGQRQRVALASVLATDPDAIVFDEPTTGLDATQQEQFMDLVARLNREEGLTVVMVTHSMGTVARYARRTVVLNGGRIEADRPTRELFADEARLADWELRPPHPVALSNRLAADAGLDDALPALSIDELVAGLGGGDA